MVTASASTAGTREEPLITLGYLSGDYAASLRADIDSTLGGTADKAVGRLNSLYRRSAGYSFAPRFLRASLTSDGTVTLITGSSFILLTGSAMLTITKGAVINVSTGSESISGEQLAANRRYFCTENTLALIKTSAASTGLIDGYFKMTGGSFAKPHNVFKDVMDDNWFFDAVCYVYDSGLFKGTADDMFSPDVTMTRAMFVTVLHRLDGTGGTGPAAQAAGRFSDVPESEWFADAVVWATANGMITGYDDGTFRPNDPLTREQMAVIIYRYALYKGRNMSTPGTAYDAFPDRGDVSDYAVPAMRWVVSNGVINGSDGKLIPLNSATRAQVAQIFWNYCRLGG